jgi:peptidyl-prolyl cis-trans isomerase C
MIKKVLFCLFLNSVVCNSHADDNILIQLGDTVITEEMLEKDIRASALQNADLLLSEKQINDYIDVYYREKLFENSALKNKLDQTDEFKSLLGITRRRLLVSYYVSKKKEEIKAPAMLNSAKEFYRFNKKQFKVNQHIEARHILLKSKLDSPERKNIQEKMNGILLEAKKDPSLFEELAKKHSEDSSASKGGYIGKFSKGKMVSEFEKEAFALTKSGQLSEVFSTEYGFHIIQLIKIHPSHTAPFEEVKEQIVDKIRRGYVEDEYTRWRAGIVDPSKAKINKDKLQNFVRNIVAKSKGAKD